MASFQLVAGLASIAGLFFSLAAFLQAWGAKLAAEQARDRTLLRTLTDEFEVACSKIDQLLDFLRSDRLPEAGLRADELASALSEIPYRRSVFLERGNEGRPSECQNPDGYHRFRNHQEQKPTSRP